MHRPAVHNEVWQEELADVLLAAVVEGHVAEAARTVEDDGAGLVHYFVSVHLDLDGLEKIIRHVALSVIGRRTSWHVKRKTISLIVWVTNYKREATSSTIDS